MRTIHIEEKSFKFPTDLSELTIGKFQEVTKIEIDPDDELGSYSKIISTISEIPEETLEEISYTDFKQMIGYCQFLFDESLNTDPKFEVIIENEKYKFDSEISKYSLRNYLDLDTVRKESQRNKLEVENLPIMIAMMYRKVNKKVK